MATLKKYDLLGKEVGKVDLDDSLLEIKAHPQSIKDYIVAMQKNARQWSANTKVRSEVNRTRRKPHPQKGQGRSRQGDLAAPHYKGGAVVFGPRPKFNIHVRINKKERRAAIRSLIAEKVKEGNVHVLTDALIETPKTKKMAQFFHMVKLQEQRVLVLGRNRERERTDAPLVKSMRNLPKKDFLLLGQLNGYDLAKAKTLVVLEPALEEFLSILGAS